MFPGGFGFLLPPPPPAPAGAGWWLSCCSFSRAHVLLCLCPGLSVFLCSCCLPPLVVPVVWLLAARCSFLLVCCLLGLSALAFAPPPPPSLLCVARVFLSCPFVLVFSCCCQTVCRLFPPGAAPPPLPRACFCVAGVVARVAWCFAVLPGVLCGPVLCCAVSSCRSLVVRCRLVLSLAALRCVVSSGAVRRRGVLRGAVWVAVPCCGVFCFGPCVLWCCGVLFVLCLAMGFWSAFLCTGLCLLALCCAALRPVGPCSAVLLRTMMSVWRCAAFVPALWRCFVLYRTLRCCVLCCALCFAVLCCSVFCCTLGYGVWVHCAVLFALCLAVLSWSASLCSVLCLLALCCTTWRRVVPCGAVLLCTVLAAWCSAAFSCAVGCSFVLCRTLRCCVLCCVPCCAVLCCSLLCRALGCGILVRCTVLFAFCLAVLSGSVFLCAVLCLLVLCCAALRPVAPCGAVLLRTVLCVWCCAAFSRAFWCCFVLFPAFGLLCNAVACCAVWCGALLCCPVLCALCYVCFAVVLWCVLFLLLSVVLLAPCGILLCALLPSCIFKRRKTVSCIHLLCRVHPVLLACQTLEQPACFICLLPGLAQNLGCVLVLLCCVLD